MQPQVTRMYRVKTVAAMFDVSASTIYRAIESGKLEALKIGAGRGRGSVRIPEYALRTFQEACVGAACRPQPVHGSVAGESVAARGAG